MDDRNDVPEYIVIAVICLLGIAGTIWAFTTVTWGTP